MVFAIVLANTPVVVWTSTLEKLPLPAIQVRENPLTSWEKVEA